MEFVNCPKCNGSGYVRNNCKCDLCAGLGLIKEHEAIDWVKKKQQHLTEVN